MPWDPGWFRGWRTDNYDLLVGVLPASPGKISMVEKFHEPQDDIKHYVGPSHHLSSQRDGGNVDHKNVRSNDAADSGCSIVRASVALKGSGHGEQEFKIIEITEKSVVTEATTIYQRFGSSGVNDYWIEFDQKCSSLRESTQTTEISIRWGERRSIDLHERNISWTVRASSFDGSHDEFGRPGGNQFLTVSADAGHVEVKASSADTLRFP